MAHGDCKLFFECKFVHRTRTKEKGLVVFVRSSSDGNGARFYFPSVKLVRRTRTKEKVSVISMGNEVSHKKWLTVIVNHFSSAKLQQIPESMLRIVRIVRF